ncbi:hypothetical protein M8J77_026431 [Diaphorina citri]|nr:hypothetical protein M8J77_026431 [Diaphorina citri]
MKIDFPIVPRERHIRRKKTTELDYLSTFSITFTKSTDQCEILTPADNVLEDGDSASKENIAGKMQKSSEPIKTTTYTVSNNNTTTYFSILTRTTNLQIHRPSRYPLN